MGSLGNVLRHFIVRDAVYITGGGMVLTSFLYAFDRLDAATLQHVPAAFYILGVPVAHAIGYAVGDTASWLMPRVFPAHQFHNPPRFTKWAYRRLTGSVWKNLTVDVDDAKSRAESEAEKEFGPYHRLVMLRHVGVVDGVCAVIAALWLMLGAWRHGGPTVFDAALIISSLAFGVALCISGGVKAAQQADYLRRHPRSN